MIKHIVAQFARKPAREPATRDGRAPGNAYVATTRSMRRLRWTRTSFVIAALALLVPFVGTAAGPPTELPGVPHYFGPYPNWANSPQTQPDATVEITGDGTGAAATARVGANGAITGLTITDPGYGYTSTTVDISGAGTGAAATATVQTSGAVTRSPSTRVGPATRSPP